MDLKALLGDKYREDMTLAEALEAAKDIDPTAGMVKKELLDKAASEAAKFKKELAAKQTDEEKAKEEQERIANRLTELEKEKTIADHKARLLGLGFNEELAANTAEALADGDMDTVFANQKKHQEAQEKALKTKLLDDTPKPPAPDVDKPKKTDGEKLAETLGKANAETNKAAGDIISQYIGG